MTWKTQERTEAGSGGRGEESLMLWRRWRVPVGWGTKGVGAEGQNLKVGHEALGKNNWWSGTQGHKNTRVWAVSQIRLLGK